MSPESQALQCLVSKVRAFAVCVSVYSFISSLLSACCSGRPCSNCTKLRCESECIVASSASISSDASEPSSASSAVSSSSSHSSASSAVSSTLHASSTASSLFPHAQVPLAQPDVEMQLADLPSASAEHCPPSAILQPLNASTGASVSHLGSAAINSDAYVESFSTLG